MRITLDQKAGRAGAVWSWASRIIGLTRVLVGILFLALLHNPVSVLSVTLPNSSNVTLAWSPSISPNVAGYKIYYGLASGVYSNTISVGSSTNATITGLAAGTTYYFAATAVDALGVESPFSNETSYTPGVPTIQIRAAATGLFTFTLSGLVGRTYEIEATQDFTVWTVIGIVTLGVGGSLDFTDANAANLPQRFYRALEIL